MESVRLIPPLECRLQEQYQALQSQSHAIQVALLESAQRGYLLGDTVSTMLCEKKIERDVVKVHIAVHSQKWSQTELGLGSTTFEKIGIIGEDGPF